MEQELLVRARRAQQRLAEAEHGAYVARGEFYKAVRQLYEGGASLRELASTLQLSHQRVHQIVAETSSTRRWGRPRGPRREVSCTFCGRRQPTDSMVAGPHVYICADCVGIAGAVLRAGAQASTALGPLAAVPAGDGEQACSFCGKHRHQAEAVAVQTSASPAICAECLSLCDQILLERQGPQLSS